jgi:hypothetical protein
LARKIPPGLPLPLPPEVGGEAFVGAGAKSWVEKEKSKEIDGIGKEDGRENAGIDNGGIEKPGMERPGIDRGEREIDGIEKGGMLITTVVPIGNTLLGESIGGEAAGVGLPACDTEPRD